MQVRLHFLKLVSSEALPNHVARDFPRPAIAAWTVHALLVSPELSIVPDAGLEFLLEPHPEDGGDEVPLEEVAFNFGKINWTYTQQDRKTGAGMGNVSAFWDLTKNVGSK